MQILKQSLGNFFLMILSTLFIRGTAQTYVVMGTDQYMDGLCAFYTNGKNISYGDLGKVSYAFNISQDSVWFKIETPTNSPRNTDFGFYILIDKDNDLTNGINTGGGPGQCTGITNFNMKYDVIIQHSFNGNNVAANFSSSSLGAVAVKYVDSCVTIARTKLSLVDHNSDGNIHFIVGLGGKNKEVYDIFPDTGYLSTGSSGILENNKSSGIKILSLPNPCLGTTTVHYYLSENSVVNVFVYDIMGKRVLQPLINEIVSKGYNDFLWDTSSLGRGAYLVEIRTQNGFARQKVLIQ